ncbi:MAG: hypothetical protein GQ534_07000, partial [Candidatus Delongbacteria bacterium]|nr:hypothetical protein [Candidatus Delongbacteria bacterium]
IEQTDDYGFIVTGITYSYSPGSSDFWLIKTDQDGNMEWDKSFGEPYENEYSYSVQQTSDGGYIMTGKYSTLSSSYDVWLIKTDKNGNEIWNKIYGGVNEDYGYSVKETRDGGYIIVGGSTSYSATYAVWLIKTDSSGNMLWNSIIDGQFNDKAFEVQETIDGGFIIAGQTLSFGGGENDFWLIKTDSNGNELWDKTVGGPSDDFAYSVEQTSDGGYVMAGTTSSYGAGGMDVWLIKTDSYGNTIYGSAIIAINANSKLTMQNSIINNFDDYGLFINNSSPTISSNLITGNRGGIKFTSSSPQFVINNTIVDNDSIGLYFDVDSDPQLMNNIIYGNGAEEVYINNNDSDPIFRYNNIEGGSSGFGLNAGVIYTGLYESNIDTDPLYVTDTYELQEISECKDTGYPGLTEQTLSDINLPLTDLKGNPRLGGEIDMGAYEYYVVIEAPDSPTNIITSVSSNILTIDWDMMLNANSYLVYSSDDPYGTFEYIETVFENTWSIPIDANTKKFYYIISSSASVKEVKKSLR